MIKELGFSADRGLPMISGDMKILLNDWPYGFSENIVHLIVWSKFSFELDAEAADLTERSRKLIEEYIKLVFEPHLDLGRVRCIRTWES